MNKRKCKFCGTYTRSFIKTNIGVFCNKEHFLSYVNNKNEERRLLPSNNTYTGVYDKSKESRFTLKLRNEKKEKTAAKNAAIRSFNSYIVTRDMYLNCISCGRDYSTIITETRLPISKIWNAGHYKTVGAHEQLRFNTLNCHKQCVFCNNGHNHRPELGTTVIKKYRVALIDKIGIDRVTRLENSNKLEKRNIDYYRRIKKIFDKKLTLLLKGRTNTPTYNLYPHSVIDC